LKKLSTLTDGFHWKTHVIDSGLYRLKNVDYSQRGEVVSIIIDGIIKPQTVIFSGVDYFGERYYFTEEGGDILLIHVISAAARILFSSIWIRFQRFSSRR
jgi:hypothetical protein